MHVGTSLAWSVASIHASAVPVCKRRARYMLARYVPPRHVPPRHVPPRYVPPRHVPSRHVSGIRLAWWHAACKCGCVNPCKRRAYMQAPCHSAVRPCGCDDIRPTISARLTYALGCLPVALRSNAGSMPVSGLSNNELSYRKGKVEPVLSRRAVDARRTVILPLPSVW